MGSALPSRTQDILSTHRARAPEEIMATETYNLIFLPELRDNVDPDEVKRNLAQTLSVDLEKVEAWYASGTPSAILKDVTDDVAERYMRAIIKCGAQCSVEPTESNAGGLSLVPKRFRTTDVFTCPSCQYQEEVPLGETLEVCPECDLVLSKWEEHQAAEKEKEAIRRRLMRQQRLQDDRSADVERKKAELERLKKLEAEIMAELGVKPPSALMRAFQRHPAAITFAGIVIVAGATVAGMVQLNSYLLDQETRELAEAEASAEVQAMAPVVSSAIQLQQTGAQQVMAEMAKVTGIMQGDANLTPQQAAELTAAATMMMKGGGADGFVSVANAGAGGVSSYETLGAASDLPGVEQFPADTLATMGAASGEHGNDAVFAAVGATRLVTNPADPNGPPIAVGSVERLDGSQMVNLMKGLQNDREWDLFLLRNQERLVGSDELDRASVLADRIKNPEARIDALANLARAFAQKSNATEVRLAIARIQVEIDRIASVDLQAKLWIQIGRSLAEFGIENEPANSINRVTHTLEDEDDPLVKSQVLARLGAAYVADGDRAEGKRRFDEALNHASQISDLGRRIIAFARMAPRYHDARNTTLAQKILTDAGRLAVERLDVGGRARAFAEIALAQAYIGDFDGVELSVSNTGHLQAQDQVYAKLTEQLIDRDKPFMALAMLKRVTDAGVNSRLRFRVVSLLVHHGDHGAAAQQMATAESMVNGIRDEAQRAIILAQLGRQYARIQRNADRDRLFDEAESIALSLPGKKGDINRGAVAIDEARALLVSRSRSVVARIENPLVRDPIDSEVLAIKRVAENYLTP